MSDKESSQESGKNSNDSDTLRQNLADAIRIILPTIDSSPPTSNGEPNSDEKQDQRIKRLADLITDNLDILKPLSNEDREERISETKEELKEVAKEVISFHDGPMNHIINLVDVAAKQIGCHEQVLFDWNKFNEEKYNAELASVTNLYKYPNLIVALNEAGDIFEKAQCNCLNKKTGHFQSKLKNARQIDAFVKAVTEGIKVLPIPGLDIILNTNDVILAVSNCIKACLHCGRTKGKSYERYAIPIVMENHVAWVKYEFFTEQVITTKCITKKRIVELETIATFFCFPDEMQFRLSLFRAYQIIRKQKTVKP